MKWLQLQCPTVTGTVFLLTRDKPKRCIEFKWIQCAVCYANAHSSFSANYFKVRGFSEWDAKLKSRNRVTFVMIEFE